MDLAYMYSQDWKFILNDSITVILKTHMINNKVGELTLVDIQTYYKVIVTKNVWS